MTEIILDEPSACDYLRLSGSTLRRWRKHGVPVRSEPMPVKIANGKYFYERSALNRWVLMWMFRWYNEEDYASDLQLKTVVEAADFLGITPAQWVQHRCHSEWHVPWHYVGGTYRYVQKDLEGLIAEGSLEYIPSYHRHCAFRNSMDLKAPTGEEYAEFRSRCRREFAKPFPVPKVLATVGI